MAARISVKRARRNLKKLDGVIEPILRAARIPGGAIAVVCGDEIALARGYGYREVDATSPLTPGTLYPIASTTKGLNATLLGMLVDEGLLAWDAPVQRYLPWFRLHDAALSDRVSLRDLITMRTGLPRHDFAWNRNPLSRGELVSRFQALELSASFRERFQYNNLTVTAAGHIAEVVTGQSWESLVREKIIKPLEMASTVFALPSGGEVTQSYHEDRHRRLVLNRHFSTELIAPAGGAIYSNVLDMARFLSFNLSGGRLMGTALIQPNALAEIHAPQIPARGDGSSPSANACYAMGWFLDTYRGSPRLCHGGYIHDVNSEVTLYPEEGIGIVSFINFGCVGLARTLNQHVFDVIQGVEPARTAQEKLAEYERRVEEIAARDASLPKIPGTSPSHAISHYVGAYLHPGYGQIEIHRAEQGLSFVRGDLIVPLEHWQYDAWVAKENDRFLIHLAHPFDRASRFLFETDADGKIAALSLRLEPAVSAIRFVKS